LETGSGVFIGGIAVAPVTNWIYYDTVYTERFMLTPQENPDGYTKSSVHDYAKINGTDYFIVHGTADGLPFPFVPFILPPLLFFSHVFPLALSDNVHFQHSLVLMNDLTQANVDFSVHIYTDNDHSINTGPNTQRDLYRRFTDYLKIKQALPRP
jgi:dipeptidyl aminopeptidase/acylaminoacyl peptidase